MLLLKIFLFKVINYFPIAGYLVMVLIFYKAKIITSPISFSQWNFHEAFFIFKNSTNLIMISYPPFVSSHLVNYYFFFNKFLIFFLKYSFSLHFTYLFFYLFYTKLIYVYFHLLNINFIRFLNTKLSLFFSLILFAFFYRPAQGFPNVIFLHGLYMILSFLAHAIAFNHVLLLNLMKDQVYIIRSSVILLFL